MKYLSILLVGALMCLGCSSGDGDGDGDGGTGDAGDAGDAGTSEAGSIGQTCYPNGTCNTGLDCQNNVCVAEAAEGGAGQACYDNGTCDDGLDCLENTCLEETVVDGDWIRIAGGSFQMGSNDGNDDERPVHEVQVPAFDLWRTEVTVAQYRACVDAGACTTPNTENYCNWNKAGRDEHPINCVDWDQAQAFATWAGGRLPTEAEWEYAARSGGRDQTYPWGDAVPTCDLAIMGEGGDDDGCGEMRTWPVCSKPAGNSAQGACDLAGNVREWTEDWYGDYDDTPRDGSAHMQASSARVHRGGGWYNDRTGPYLRAARRNMNAPSARYDDLLGFRLSRSVP